MAVNLGACYYDAVTMLLQCSNDAWRVLRNKCDFGE